MSDVEYVVNFGSDKSIQFVKLSMAEVEHHGARIGEPIVRCRYCKHLDVFYPFDVYRMKQSETPELHCTSSQFANWDFPIEVEYDGFCAWGERREA